MIAIFGRKSFIVSSDRIYTFNGLNITTKLNTEKQENSNKKPSTYIKNTELSSFEITIKLDSSYGTTPRVEFEDWINLQNEKRAYPFLLGGKPLLNTKYLLVGVSSSEELVDNKGNIIAMIISLKFDEFVRAGSKSSSNSSQNNKNTNSVYVALKPRDKSELKVSLYDKKRKIYESM